MTASEPVADGADAQRDGLQWSHDRERFAGHDRLWLPSRLAAATGVVAVLGAQRQKRV